MLPNIRLIISLCNICKSYYFFASDDLARVHYAEYVDKKFC